MTKPTAYHRPTTLDEALRTMAEPGAVALAGGALLFGTLESTHDSIVDLQGVVELNQIEVNRSNVRIGAAVKLQAVIEHPDVLPIFKRALSRTLPLNLRNNTSVGETFLVDPPREWLAALMAIDAGIERAFPDGERMVDGLLSLLDGSARRPASKGFITAVEVPTLRAGEMLGSAFVARTPADQPIVNAAVFARVDSNRTVEIAFAAIGGASAQPVAALSLRSLEGNPLDEANIASAVKQVAAQVDPLGDFLRCPVYAVKQDCRSLGS